MNEKNPDFDPRLFEFQNRNIERIAKRMENRTLGFRLENAGDIVRELTLRESPAESYIREKVACIELEFENSSELTRPLSQEDARATRQLVELHGKMKLRSDRAKAAREILNAIANHRIFKV